MSHSASTGRSGAARGSWWSEKDPSRELGRLCGELRQLADRVERGGEPAARHWMPSVEEADGGDAYLVRAELPGIPRECVKVEMDGRELYISGTLDESSAQNALGRRIGTFSFGVRVPGDADHDQVRADLVDGVLTVRLTKSGEHATRPVAVGTAVGG
ncbi:Hsp20/alpha crystallin family protein [Streptomyces albidoflavus]